MEDYSTEPRNLVLAALSVSNRFNEEAQKAFALALKEAEDLNHNYIGTEHILLGLLRNEGSIAAKALANLDIQAEQVRNSVECIIGLGQEDLTEHEIKITPRSKKIIELAIDEAQRQNQPQIGTEHLLLGLMHEGQGVAAAILLSLGVSLLKVREQIMSLTATSPTDSRAGSTKDNVVTCRIDARDLESIDALVEAGIRSTRSDAASWLIHAGIQANHAMFQKVSATVIEIRRLREEAQAAIQ